MRQVWRSLALAEIFPLKAPKHEQRATTHKVVAFLLWLLQTLNRHCWSLMREKTQNVALPQPIDCQDGDEPRNFGVSCGNDEALCWFSAIQPPVTQAEGKRDYKPHLWRDTIIVYLSLQRDTGARSILGWPNFNLNNVTKRSFVIDDHQHVNTAWRGLPWFTHLISFLPIGLLLSEFERQIHEQRKVTKVVSRSTWVSQERVNLLKTKLSACGTLCFFSDRLTS